MDNPNNPNVPNNPTLDPLNQVSSPPPSPPSTPQPPTEAVPSYEAGEPPPFADTPSPLTVPTPAAPASDLTPAPELTSAAPTVPEPILSGAQSNQLPYSEPSSPWMASQTQTPTPTPPLGEPAPPQPQVASVLSRLDNPWKSPLQPPPINAAEQTPPQSAVPTFSNPSDVPNPPTTYPPTQPQPESQNPVQNMESAPTDLSHLITSSQLQTPQPAVTQAETLVVPLASNGPEVPTISAEKSGGIPKWVVGVGIGLLLLVAGASAYFILGLGQAPKTSSLPATQTTPKPQATATPPTPTPAAQSEATGSGSFGGLSGSTTQQQATSAADLLRQRQQAR